VNTVADIERHALKLSGYTGTVLKTEVIAEYYSFWQRVTSGGSPRRHMNPTFIIDMNAGSGLLRVEEDPQIVIYGSAGHALELKFDSGKTISANLTIMLVEEDTGIRDGLMEVIRTKWPEAALSHTGDGRYQSSDGRVTLFKSARDLMKHTEDGAISGNCLFLFDELLATEWTILDNIASARVSRPYKTGTEFLLFFFTSDWITGRHSELLDIDPLPTTRNMNQWSGGQNEAAMVADRLYLSPLFVARAITIDRLAIDVTTGDAGKIARLGIYANGTNCYPGVLVVDAGTVSVADVTVVAAIVVGMFTLSRYGTMCTITALAPTN